MNNQTLVNNIKNICKEKNISVSTLERELFMSPGLISRWAKTTPTLDRVLDIASYLQVSLDDLTGNNTEKNSNDRTTNHLLLKLYKETTNAEIDWEIFNPNNADECLTTQIISSLVADNCMDCFYCNVNGGSFIITITYNNTQNELSLYALADQNSRPVLQCCNNAKLFDLYDYLLKRLSNQLNSMKTNNFINNFLNADSEPSPPNNVTFLKLTTAVNE